MSGLTGLSGLSGLSGLIGGFSPSDVSGLALWLRADIGTWQDTSKTIPAAADGDPVGAWEDQSGSGNDFTQPTPASRPTLRLAVQNGRSVLRFDGGDYLFRTDALSLGGSDQPMTLFIVAEADSFAANRDLFALGNSSGAVQYVQVMLDTTPNFSWRRRPDAGGIKSIIEGTPVANTWYVITLIFTGTLGTMRVNTLVEGDPGDDMDTNSLTLNRCAVGTLLRNIAQNQHLGDIAEVIMYDNALAQADYEQVETYLNGHWAVYTDLTGALTNLSDNFNDNSLDATRYETYTQGAGGVRQALEQNQRLELSITGAGSLSHVYVTTWDFYRMRGDFDCQVDYTISAGPATDEWILWLQAGNGGSGFIPDEEVRTSRSHRAGQGHQYGGEIRHLHVPAVLEGQGDYVATADNSGKLRIARVGSTAYTYYWTGAAWQQINSGTIGTQDMALRMWLSNDDANPDVEMFLDNLIAIADSIIEVP